MTFEQALYEVFKDTLLFVSGEEIMCKEHNCRNDRQAARHADALKLAMAMVGKTEVRHPNLAWARAKLIEAKGVSGIRAEELDTLWWDNLNGCYMVEWRGMSLGLEVDGHIHS